MHVGSIETDERVLVVAEIGNNHEGDLGTARELVEQAVAAGADAVKVQTFRTDHFVSRQDAARFARLKGFELTPEEFAELAELTHARGALFVATPLDLGSVEVLEPLVDAYKVASSDNTFFPLLERIARKPAPMIVSTGLSDIDDVAGTIEFVERIRGLDRLAILHCVSSYPVAPHEAQLRAIRALAERFECVVGYSDHTTNLDAPLLAIALGARIIEKHFTLDKHFSEFRDHQLSAEPQELTELIRRIREAESLLGTEEKVVQESERPGVVALRRSLAAAQDLDAGHVLTAADFTWLRPGGGLAPGTEEQVLGRRLRRALEFGEWIAPADVE